MISLDKNIYKIYESKKEIKKGDIIYLHGGGFIFGRKDDLPQYHIDRITEAGFNIIAIDYPLAPETKFPLILKDVINTINLIREERKYPYFLWGRSAGAYLSLLLASMELTSKPKGIVSYYGYGFFTSDWYDKPSQYYGKYPMVDKGLVNDLIEDQPIYNSPANPRFLLYLYGRQRGSWLKLLWDQSIESFMDKYSLNEVDFSNYPPVLLAHNIKDTDVPYEESIELSKRIKNAEFMKVYTEDHDFDKNEEDENTVLLLDKTINFFNENL